MVKPHPRPLLDVVAGFGEVDAGDGADPPLRVGEAAGVAVDDRVVGHPCAKRIVLFPFGFCFPAALLGFVGAAAFFGAGPPCRLGRCPHRAPAHPSAPGGFGKVLEVVGRLVDRLQMELVLVPLALRRKVRMPPLGKPPPRQLDIPLVERRLELKQQERPRPPRGGALLALDEEEIARCSACYSPFWIITALSRKLNSFLPKADEGRSGGSRRAGSSRPRGGCRSAGSSETAAPPPGPAPGPQAAGCLLPQRLRPARCR